MTIEFKTLYFLIFKHGKTICSDDADISDTRT